MLKTAYPKQIMLELDSIAQFYGHNLVFKDINCRFTVGSVTLLLGNNGAGKSTLLRIMAGLVRPSSGTVHFTMRSPQIAYLAHATFVYPGLTARENLLFWREAYGLKQTESDLFKLLERVDLAARANDRAGTFSRGMAQRLNLARVLLINPDILLLDEPGTGLDTTSQAVLRKEVTDAKMRQACVILVSHDAVRDLPLADKVLLLEKGHLAYDGPSSLFPSAKNMEPACCA